MIPRQNKYQKRQKYNYFRRCKEQVHVKCAEVVCSADDADFFPLKKIYV